MFRSACTRFAPVATRTLIAPLIPRLSIPAIPKLAYPSVLAAHMSVFRDDGKTIDGKAVCQEVVDEVAEAVTTLKAEKGITPGLAVLLVGARPDSATYVKTKERLAVECGFNSWVHRMEEDVSEDEIMALLKKLGEDDECDGILVQLPLPSHINQKRVLNAVSVEKDVDGFHPTNMGTLLRIGEDLKQKGEKFTTSSMGCMPCTPVGCLELLERSGVKIEGANAVVIGRSNIVGLPLALMLLHKNAIVTILHSKSKDLPAAVKQADIVCAAIGVPEFVQGDWIKPGAAVIDVGINFKEDATRKSGRRMCGDVDFKAAYDNAGVITPVPGGVGPMTVAMLMKNTLVNCLARRG